MPIISGFLDRNSNEVFSSQVFPFLLCIYLFNLVVVRIPAYKLEISFMGSAMMNSMNWLCLIFYDVVIWFFGNFSIVVCCLVWFIVSQRKWDRWDLRNSEGNQKSKQMHLDVLGKIRHRNMRILKINKMTGNAIIFSY